MSQDDQATVMNRSCLSDTHICSRLAVSGRYVVGGIIVDGTSRLMRGVSTMGIYPVVGGRMVGI